MFELPGPLDIPLRKIRGSKLVNNVLYTDICVDTVIDLYVAFYLIRAVISIYARPTSATFCTMSPSMGAAMTHASFASSPTINHMNCVFPVHPTPLRQNLFGGSAVGAAAVRSCSFTNSNSTHFGHSMRPYCPKGPLEPMNLCRTQMF